MGHKLVEFSAMIRKAARRINSYNPFKLNKNQDKEQ